MIDNVQFNTIYYTGSDFIHSWMNTIANDIKVNPIRVNDDFGNIFSRNFSRKKSQFTFTFVRNPYEREIAIWKHENPSITFKQHVESLVKNRPVLQTTGLDDVDYIGRFEALPWHLQDLCCIVYNVYKPVNSKKTPKPVWNYKDYYTDDLIDIISSVYSTDINDLGYDYDQITISNKNTNYYINKYNNFYRNNSIYKRISILKHELSKIDQQNNNFKRRSEVYCDDVFQIESNIYRHNSIIEQINDLQEYMKERDHLIDIFDQSNDVVNQTNTIDSVYYITLHKDEHNDRITKLKSAFNNVNVVDAVDTRSNVNKCKEFGLNLAVAAKDLVWNFSTSAGATGCYLSHWLICKDILDKDYKKSLILEDDVDIDDVVKFLTSFNHDMLPDKDYIQLNKRSYEKGNPDEVFCDLAVNGTESFILTTTGARKILDGTSQLKFDDSILNTITFHKYISTIKSVYGGGNTYDTDYIISMDRDKLVVPNSIKAPIDRFISIMCNPAIHNKQRLSWFNLPIIGLDTKLSVESEVVTHTLPHWELDREECKKLYENW